MQYSIWLMTESCKVLRRSPANVHLPNAIAIVPYASALECTVEVCLALVCILPHTIALASFEIYKSMTQPNTVSICLCIHAYVLTLFVCQSLFEYSFHPQIPAPTILTSFAAVWLAHSNRNIWTYCLLDSDLIAIQHVHARVWTRGRLIVTDKDTCIVTYTAIFS